MRRVDLAKHLISAASDAERRRLLAGHPNLTDEKLAGEIRKICYSSWTVEPVKARRAAAAINTLAKFNKSTEVSAAALWINGISNITKGRFEAAVSLLDGAASILKNIGREVDAAQADVAKLLALAMLGRYDEAIKTGEMALKTFVGAGDELAAGKIEMNLSNIVSRQSRHHDAEKYCRSARRRFMRSGHKSWQAMAENGLANTYTELFECKKAEHFYQMALAAARAEKMRVTEAEIEASLGNLATLRGRYAEALKYLETSRQKYDELGMPHQSAIADLEIADIYSELNLLTEAAEIYKRVKPRFHNLKLRSEEARTSLNSGRCAAKLGNLRFAKTELNKASALFSLEQNNAGQMWAGLALAELEIAQKRYDEGLSILAKTAVLIDVSGNARHSINRNLLEGEAFTHTGDHAKAAESLAGAVRLARKHKQADSLQSAHNVMGRLSLTLGETSRAKSHFSKAIKLVEEMRSPLSAAEFSMAYLSSRLEPFANLANLLLGEKRVTAAFRVFEQGRSRSLLDAFGSPARRTGVPKKLDASMIDARTKLNFFYRKLDATAGVDRVRLTKEIHYAEAKLAALSRQIDSVADPLYGSNPHQNVIDLKNLQRQLGGSKTLIEFIQTGGRVSAFVLTGKKIRFVRDLGTISEVNARLEDLHFQFGSLRYGGQTSRFADQIKKRTDQVLRRLYDQLLRPLTNEISGETLVIIPVGPLHYVPFHALHDGRGYVAENFETSYAPSAAIWSKLRERRYKPIRRSLLIGFADERIPLVENEIHDVSTIVPSPAVFTGEAANFATFYRNSQNKDLIHLACHGQFRPDNPMFSSLHLADGWITVQDICAQKLTAGLVTLSACETGLSEIFAGDEILGLARGFLSAGAASIVVSLWTVNDVATARLMKSFYTHLQRTASVAASLRQAQLEFIGRGEHAFLWSPFILIGR